MDKQKQKEQDEKLKKLAEKRPDLRETIDKHQKHTKKPFNK